LATDAAGERSDELADFGYNQTLDRSIGKFASFAAGISYISILTARSNDSFSLGRLGLPINLTAVAWGTCMTINLLWPRKDVYNAIEPFHWYLQYRAFLFIGIVFFGGLAYYWFVQRHKTGVLASHAAIERALDSQVAS
jgi:hypothetical protein